MWQGGILIDGELRPELANALEHWTDTTTWEPDALVNFVRWMVKTAAREARVAELARVYEATLDADDDVWSLTDDGQIIPLTTRIQQL